MSLAFSSRKMAAYTGNNSTVAFTYNFLIFDQSHLKVTVRDLSNVDTVLTIGTDYTVSGVRSITGGLVTLVDANQSWLDSTSNGLKLNFKLYIEGATPLVQNTDIRNQGSYYPSLHEDAFDRTMMIAQEMNQKVARAILFPADAAEALRTLPAAVTGKAIVWSASGGFENSAANLGDLSSLVTAAQAAKTAAELAETNAETAETNAETAETAAAASAAAAAQSALDAASVAGGNKYLDYGSLLNADLTIPSNATYSYIRMNASTTRTITLPAANAVPAGRYYVFNDLAGLGASVVVQRAGADTIEGSTSITLSLTNFCRMFISNGVNGWRTDSIKQTEITSSMIASLNGDKLSMVSSSTKTGAYTATSSDSVIPCNTTSASFTLTLPSAASTSGRRYFIHNIGTANILTIDPNAAELIDGASTKTLQPGEKISIIGNGTGWVIETYVDSTSWVAYTPTLVGFGTPTNLNIRSRKLGGNLEVIGSFTGGTSTAVEARIPLGFAGVAANVNAASWLASPQAVGCGAFSTVGALFPAILAEPSVGYLTVGLQASGSGGLTKQNGSALVTTGNSFRFTASIPIDGW